MNSTQTLTEYINTNTPCMFVKYGDGEMLAATYSQGENCDRTPYTTNLGDKLRLSFIYNSQQSNSLIAIWHNINSHKLFWESLLSNEKQISNVNCVNYHTIIIDYLHSSSDKLELYKAIKYSKRNKIYIANNNMGKSKTIFNIDHHISIHPNNWFETEYQSVFNDVTKKIIDDSNTMVLTSAGMGAKYLISELHRLYPNAIYLDIGSAFDIICTGIETRGEPEQTYSFMSEYLQPLTDKKIINNNEQITDKKIINNNNKITDKKIINNNILLLLKKTNNR